MLAIMGSTGHVGGHVARTLRAQEVPVRAIVRERDRGAALAADGAEIAVADLTDRQALAAALRGCDGAFVMLPTVPSGKESAHLAMVDSIVEAVQQSAARHVVVLSSWGAQHADGTGPIRWLHSLEGGLRGTGAVVTALRACHFQEKVEMVLGAAMHEGVFPVLGAADRPTPMVATRDIGAVAARCLLNPPAAHEAVVVESAAVTERRVAQVLAAAIGREVQVVEIPRQAWEPSLIDAGVATALAAELAAMYEADERGVLTPVGDRTVTGPTPIEITVPDMVTQAGMGVAATSS